MLSPAVPVSVPSELAAIVLQVLRQDALDLSAAARLADLAGWDPFHRIAVLVETECRFGILLDIAEIEAVETVEDLSDLVETKTRTARS